MAGLIDTAKFPLFQNELRTALLNAALRMIDASEAWKQMSDFVVNATSEQALLANHREVNARLTKLAQDELAEIKSYKAEKLGDGPGWLHNLVDYAVDQREALVEAIRKHDRELALMAGETIAPEVHFASAVLIGRLGGGTG